MKEHIINEITEVLHECTVERLRVIVRLISAIAEATDRTAELSEKTVLSIARHAK